MGLRGYLLLSICCSFIAAQASYHDWFILLVYPAGKRICMRQRFGNGDVLNANAKLLPLPAISFDCASDQKMLSISARSAPGFIDQHVHLIGGGGEAGP